ncbi:luminescence regulatory protein LuxO [bacterium BMS3Bbin03]|nr:luminescence regulatory protein LuxO [bacterium BMS3Bbin03]HDZ12805.1 sigma-54-dependent Fis family transcriptional regulator [Bacteroidota bacterium]
MSKILIIEDKKSLRRSLAITLQLDAHEVLEAENGEQGISLLKKNRVDLVVTDMRLPGMDGIEVLKQAKTNDPNIEVIVMTAFGTIKNAVEAMQSGAFDYVSKPFREDEFRIKVKKALEKIDLNQKVKNLEKIVQRHIGFQKIVTVSPVMKAILNQVQYVAPTDSSVFISGESGTGKELIAGAVHQLSNRKDKPFIPVNCGAIPENLLESELFGHVRGAFTGAVADKKGLIEQADGGTLFLDEIGEASHGVQVRLLRFLENGEIRRVGDAEIRYADVRLITATNKDLEATVKSGGFREDLFYRIHVIPLHLPPLRERKEDILVLAYHFLKKYNRRFHKPLQYIASEVFGIFLSHSWPGNVREMENVMEYACTFAKPPKIIPDNLPQYLEKPIWKEAAKDETNSRTLADVERSYILHILDANHGHQKKACKILGISKTTLYRRLKSYNMSLPKT